MGIRVYVVWARIFPINSTCAALQYNYNDCMKLHFEWDEHKAAANVKKHGVSFEEAKPLSTMNKPS